MRTRIGWAIGCGVAAVAAGCGEERAREPAPVAAAVTEAPAVSAAPAEPARPAPAPEAFLDQELSALLGAVRTQRVERARELPGISLAFKLDLAGPIDCVWKPEVRGQRQRWQGEVAAYRIARLLGIADLVPPAETRRVGRDELLRVLRDDDRGAEARVRTADVPWDDVGTVIGGAGYWVPDVRERALEKESEATVWRPWLRQGHSIPDRDWPVASFLSRAIVFDHVIGNWDRFSGGGFLERPGTEEPRLFLIDHNAAFYSPIPAEAAERFGRRLKSTERFGRGIVARMRALDRAAIQAELARDGSGIELLDAQQIDELMARLDEVLSHVDALVAAHDEASVLLFQ